MSEDREPTWYVKASFGAEWGPMTTATLLEMDERGSLGPGDMVRCGNNGDWRDVAEVLAELTNDTPVRDNDDSPSPADFDNEESTTVAESSKLVSKSSRRPGALPGWSSFWTPSSPNEPTEEAPRKSSLASWKLAVSEPSSDSHDEDSLRSEVTAVESETGVFPIRSEPSHETTDAQPCDLTLPNKELELLNEWKQHRTEELVRLKAIVAEREAAIARAAEEAKAAEARAATQAMDDEVTPSEGTSDSSPKSVSPSPAKPELKPPAPSATQRHSTQQESWNHTLARWKRSLPDWKFAILVVLLPFAAWWLWPASYGGVAAEYRSMYKRLREIRDRPQDKTGMREFVEQSQAKLDKLIPRLKERATPKDPDSQLLLWIGRDCLQPMLKSPHTRNTKHEENLKRLLAQWDQAHHVVVTEEPPESDKSSSDNQALPPPPPDSKPLGFGRSPEPAEPTEAGSPEATPTTKNKPQLENDKAPN